MLDSFIKGSIRYRAIVLLATACITAFGVYAFRHTSVEAYPDVTNLQVNIIAQNAGLAPEEIERQITIPLEKILNGIPNAKLIRSESLFGLSLIWIVFDDNAEAFTARSHVMERLLKADLPDSATVELAPNDTPLGKIYYYHLASATRTLTDLRTIQETTVQRHLRGVQGVADVTGVGGYLKEVNVELLPAKLKALHLTMNEVIDRVQRSNQNAGGGFLIHGNQEFVVRSIGRIQNADDIRSIVLRAKDGAAITLGDVANIYQGYTPRRGRVALDHHDDIVEGIVLMRRGENPHEVLQRIRSEIDNLNENVLPGDVHIEPIYDRGVMIDSTLSTVYTNLFHGALLVIAVCWLFLRIFRGSMAVTIVIPIALVSAFIGLYLMKLPANLISMGAIDFGILADGAVVLLENVQKHIQKHRPQTKRELRDVVARASVEIARPTFFAMAIIIAAMVPIFTLQSVEGRIFRPLALTYIFALVGALIATLTVIPAICSLLYRPQDADVRDFAFVRWLETGYHRSLQWLTTRRWLVTPVPVAIVCGSVFVGTRLGTEFLPELDEGDIYIFATAPSSISLDSAAQEFGEVRRTLMRFDEVEHVLSEQGRPEDGTDNELVNVTKMLVLLHPEKLWKTGRTKEQLVGAMRETLQQFPGIAFNFSQPIEDSVQEAISGVRGQVTYKVYGHSYLKMQQVLTQAMTALAPIDGIKDLALYRNTVVPQLKIELRRRALARHGILIEDAQQIIATALAGTISTSFYEGQFQVPIRIHVPLADREDTGAVGNITIPAPDGTYVPLRELADIAVTHGQSTIARERNQRFLALKFNIEGRAAGDVVSDAMAAVDAHVSVPDSISVRWGGEFRNQRRAMARLQLVVPLALLVVFFLIVLSVRSMALAAFVMLTLPFALSGGIFGLWAIGEEISVSAAIGFIALIGQTSLLGLIMVSHLSHDPRSAPQTGTRTAVPLVASEKLRALLTAALLSSLALLPMTISTDMGSETQRPFAAVIVFGMWTTFAAAIFIIPLLYKSWLFGKEAPNGPSSKQPHPATGAILAAGILAGLSGGLPRSASAQSSSGYDKSVRTAVRQHETAAEDDPFIYTNFAKVLALLHSNTDWQQQKTAHIEAAESGRKEARAFEDPTLSYDLEAFTGHGTDFVEGSQHSVVLEWELPLSRLRAARSAVVDAEVEQAHAQYAQDTDALAQRLQEAWAQAELHYARAITLQKSIETIREIHAIVQKRVDRGVSPRFDALSVQTRILKLQQNIDYSLDELVRNAMFVTRMLGIQHGMLMPAHTWRPPSASTIQSRLSERVPPDILHARAETHITQAKSDLARRERIPTIVLSGGLELATHAPGRAALGGVAMRLPIFGGRRGAAQQADAQARAAGLQYQWLKRQTKEERKSVLAQWKAQLSALKRHDQRIAPHVAGIEALAQRSFVGGVVAYGELIDAIDNRIEARIERIHLLADLMETYVRTQRWIAP